MPTTADDRRWLRRFARLIALGAALTALGYLISPRLAGDAPSKETPA